jgi:MazG family protein
MTAPADLRRIDALIAIMQRLRDPKTGCPWDLEQSFATIAPYTIEEAYEVADAVARGDMGDLKDELGDLLLQVAFHAQIAAEAGAFTFADVVEAICAKMLRRHPHVFADAVVNSAAEQNVAWEAHKARERAARGDSGGRALDGVPLASPALTRALKLQQRAAAAGFDWREREGIFDKLQEEIVELKQELDKGAPKARLTDELGDILFVCANLARRLGVDPEEALRSTNRKFTRRFNHIEDALKARGMKLGAATLEEMEAAWDDAKRQEAK